tara:strand:+ start:1683 stop:2195 length:513 start_codon:yes stop_codon:yes gene_type:complete
MVDIENMNLDDEWIKEIDKDENIYKKFYKSAPNYVNLYITYLDSSNNIIHIKTQTTSLKDNILSKTKLIYYISKYSKFHKKKYYCFDLIKYNIDVDSKTINKYIENPESYQYLSNESKILDIYWKDSVEIFHSINSLYIFYKPLIKTKKTSKKTKKDVLVSRKKTKKRYN